MLSTSNMDVLNTLRRFKTAGLQISFLVPTLTALKKYNMDATAGVREYLLANSLHDYKKQKQGEEYKIAINTTLISQGKVISTTTSLYRPRAKNGDPRIWPKKLNGMASPTDLLAILAIDQKLVIINCSQSDLDVILNTNGVIFKNLLIHAATGLSNIASELYSLLQQIYKKGYIKTLRPGDTGVGYTLETLLGIPANNSPKADFKGIELKSKRNRPNRDNLFSKVPDWELSRLATNNAILFTRGRYDPVRQHTRLFNTIGAITSNSHDLRLKVDSKKNQLQQIYTAKNPHMTDALWEMPVLLAALREKHYETFWVTADTQGERKSVDEHFWYRQLKHTGNLDESAFTTLLELGLVTVDYTLWEETPQQSKNKGYLFKLKPRHLHFLFDRVDTYDLSG